MAKQAPFVGRLTELSTVSALVEQHGTRKVVCIGGGGGIGKTRFLEESHRRIFSEKIVTSETIVTSGIIDFDDRRLAVVPDNLERRIAVQLGENHFREYFQALSLRRYAELSGAETGNLNRLRGESQEAFVRNFNNLSATRRVVLLFDTTDHLGPGELWNRLVDLITRARNALFLLAGRNGNEIFASLESTMGEDALLITLPNLKSEAVDQEYLRLKAQSLYINIAPEIARRILYLAKGRPILIDLAVEWLSQDIPQPWLVETNLKELGEHEEDFEAVLVRPVAQLRSPLDVLILLLSRVYPLDVAMAEEFIGHTVENVAKLFQEAREMVFVKELPDGRLSLHDEMRAMVRQYVWDEVDETGERRRRDSQHAITYFDHSIVDAERKYQSLQLVIGAVAENELIQTFIQREEADQELWFLKAQRLSHLLYIDLERGVVDFVALFDEATKAYRNAIRDSLLSEIKPYRDQLPEEHAFAVISRESQYLSDTGRFKDALPLAETALSLAKSISQEIDASLLLANLEIRLGNIDASVERFGEAVALSRKSEDLNRLSASLNGLGWAYRNKGDFDAALRNYLESFEISLEQGNNELTASILNNMAYINAYRGDYFTAIENTKRALELWRLIGDRREIGVTFSTRGEVYRRFAQWSEAIEYYQRAMAVFDDEEDREWLSTVRIGRASVLMRQERLEDALPDVEYARKHGPANLGPRTLHTEAQLCLKRNELERAKELFTVCYQESQRLGNQEYLMKSFSDSIDVSWELGSYEEWPRILAGIGEMFDHATGIEAERLNGSSLRKLGDLLMCAGEYSRALEAYEQGFELIAMHEVHAPYAVGQQLRITESRLKKCVPATAVMYLGRSLATFWKEKKLVARSSEALEIFYRWQREGADNA